MDDYDHREANLIARTAVIILVNPPEDNDTIRDHRLHVMDKCFRRAARRQEEVAHHGL